MTDPRLSPSQRQAVDAALAEYRQQAQRIRDDIIGEIQDALRQSMAEIDAKADEIAGPALQRIAELRQRLDDMSQPVTSDPMRFLQYSPVPPADQFPFFDSAMRG